MEVLFVSHKYPPAVGGMEKQSFELITGMERYCRVHKIVYDGNEGLASFFLLLNKRIQRACTDNPNIRIIHFNDGLIAAYCLRFRDSYKHLKSVVTLHGLDVVFPSSIYHRFIFPKFNQFDRLVAVSNATAAQAQKLDIRPGKITVIPNGVDTETEQVAAGDLGKTLTQMGIDYHGQPVIVAMGRPVKRKGMSWFIEHVVPKLKGDFLLLLIGAFAPEATRAEKMLGKMPLGLKNKLDLFLGFPTDNAPLRTLLAMPEVRENVKHLGRLPSEQVATLLAGANAFVMPNIAVKGDMEGFGLVCLEAVMAGATVFASEIDGIPDAIQNGKNGYLLPAGDATAWAQKMNEIISGANATNPAFRDYTVANFGWDKMVRSYYGLFQSLAGG